ncbi:MAG: DUF4296 domain-containing protein [Arachidicoccus sp.]|nr:DUF4296 domain-containing protein [Arachidicoccus sp.]
MARISETKIIIPCLLFILLFVSCSHDRVPKGILQLDKMRKVLWEMAIADQIIASDTSALVRQHLKDSTTFLYQRILKDNKINEADYKKSLIYYQSKPELMRLLIDTTYNLGKGLTDTFQKHYKPKHQVITPKKADSIHPLPPVPIKPFNNRFPHKEFKPNPGQFRPFKK